MHGSRRESLIRVLVLSVLLALVGTATAAEEPDHEALRALKQLYEQAVSEGDPSLLKAHLDERFSGVMVTGEEVDSFEALEAYWQKIQQLMGEGGRYEVQVSPAGLSQIFGDYALASGVTDDRIVTGAGKEFRFSSRWTAICARDEAGQWRLLRVQGSIDPLGNPFVEARLRGAQVATGGAALAVGLLAGGIGGVLLGRRKRERAAT